MFRRQLHIFSAVLLSALVAVSAQASKKTKRTVGISMGDQAAADTSRPRKALVIGNANYPGSPLANTKRDARDVASALKDLGFTVHSKSDLDLRNFRETTGDFLKDIHKGDIVFIFYAGHGVEIEGTNFLIPVDFKAQRASDVPYEAYPLNQLLDGITEQKPAVTVVVLDACRNNPFLANRAFGKRGLAQVNAGEGSLIAYATSPGKTASDGAPNGNGAFTESLIKFLKKPGVDIESVFKEVSDDVANKTNREQIPWRSSSIVGRYYLSGVAAQQQEEAEEEVPEPKAKPLKRPQKEVVEEQEVEEEEPAPMPKPRPKTGKSPVCWEDTVLTKWIKDATSVMGFAIEGKQHILGYDSHSGKVVTARLKEGSDKPEEKWKGKWNAGWQGMLPFTTGSSTSFFLYNPSTGRVQYEEMSANGQDSATRQYNSWRQGFTQFSSLPLPGDPAFMGYVQKTGEIVMWRVGDNYTDPNFLEGNASPGLSHAFVQMLDDQAYLMVYHSGTGMVGANLLEGNTPTNIFQGEWEKGWSYFVPVTAKGKNYLVAYRSEDGMMKIYRSTKGETVWRTVAEEAWEPGFTTFGTYRHRDKLHLILYEPESGLLNIKRQCQ